MCKTYFPESSTWSSGTTNLIAKWNDLVGVSPDFTVKSSSSGGILYNINPQTNQNRAFLGDLFKLILKSSCWKNFATMGRLDTSPKGAAVRSCDNCGRQRSSSQNNEKQFFRLLRCSGCRVARYCDASCQRAHWNAHRAECKKLKVSAANIASALEAAHAELESEVVDATFAAPYGALAETFDRGLTVVALQDIERGTVIVSENPLLLLRGEDVGGVDVVGPQEDGLCEDADERPDSVEGKMSRAAAVQAALVYEKVARRGEELYATMGADQRRQYNALSDACTGSAVEKWVRDRWRKLGGLKKSDSEIFTPLLPAGGRSSSSPGAEDERGDFPSIVCGNEESGPKSIQGILRTNAIPYENDNAIAVCAKVSRFNHSCRPNAQYQWRPARRLVAPASDEEVVSQNDSSSAVVVALRRIQKGEEISVYYFEGDILTRQERKTRFLRGWAAPCGCAQSCFTLMQRHAVVLKKREFAKGFRAYSDAELDAIPDEIFAVFERSKQAIKDSDHRRTQLKELRRAIDERLHDRVSTAGATPEDERTSNVHALLAEQWAIWQAEDLLPNLALEEQWYFDKWQATGDREWGEQYRQVLNLLAPHRVAEGMAAEAPNLLGAGGG